MSLRIRKGDLVQVIAGADRGKQGHVTALDSETGRIRVEGVRMQKRHLKPGRAGSQQGGIIEREGFIDVSNVMLVDTKAGAPSRYRVTVSDDGKKSRVFTKSGTPVPNPAG